MKEIMQFQNANLETIYDGNLRIGSFSEIRNCLFAGYFAMDKFSCVSRSKLGWATGIGSFSYVSDCEISNYVSIASRVSIGAFNHPLDFLSVNEIGYRPDNWGLPKKENINIARKITKIGPDVWIGDNCFVKAGLSIGIGTIIGGGAVVLKDTPPFSIVAGNPARVIRYRLDERLRTLALTSLWWELPPNDLRDIDFSNVELALISIAEIYKSKLST